MAAPSLSRMQMQGRVLAALIMREMSTRYGRSVGGYIWAVLEPVGFIVILSVVFSQISRRPPLGDSFPMFYATGYMIFHFYRDISGVVSESIAVNRALLTFPRVTLIDAVIARFTLQFITVFFVSCLVLGSLWIITGHDLTLDVVALFQAVFFSSALGLGIGALNCVLFAYSPTWKRSFAIINRPMFLISGVFFLYEDLPFQAQQLLWWNPLIHVTALMRAAFYPIYEPLFVSFPYLMVASLTPLFFGILLLRVLKARIVDQ